MALYLKNTSGSTGTWDGVEIAAGSYYLMSTAEQGRFSVHDATLTSIGAGDLVVATSNDGNGDLGIADSINTLVGDSGITLSDPFPLNEGDWSFRGLGGSASINGSGTNGGVTNVDTLISETRYVDAAEVWLGLTTLYGVDVDFIVVDKDGVGVTLGWYDQATFDAMGNYYEVEQFGYTWQVCPTMRNNPKPGYPAVIPGGLYIRMRFTNPNVSGTTAYFNYYLHKKAT